MDLKLWYQQPAVNWKQALPIGNGRMGAMVFGKIRDEIIQVNEDTVWGGGFVNRNNPDSFAHLDEIRNCIFRGEIKKAEQIATYAMTGTPQSQRPYQSLGELRIRSIEGAEEAVNYYRDLKLMTGIAQVSYEQNECRYEREYFLSNPDDGMVVHISTTKEEGLFLDVTMERYRHQNRAYAVNATTIAVDGDTGAQGVRFVMMTSASILDGNVKTIGEHLIIEGAHEVTLFFTAATSFRFESLEEVCLERITEAAKKTYSELRKRHCQDVMQLMNRVNLSFGEESEEELPTDIRLERIRNQHVIDKGFLVLYYQYARYLMTACSRPGTMPANLQGIWCDSFAPVWDSKYTININTEMNYWFVEGAALGECHLPLFDHLERMKPNGEETAKSMYHCRGFVAHHNTDLYGDTAPQDQWIPATYWPMGAAWLCIHIWEHYEYSRDLEFLNEHYDTFYQAVVFFRDYMVEDEEGKLVTCPSSSPENAFVLPNGEQGHLTAGPAMDSQILTVLFQDFLKASVLLGKEEAFCQQVKEMLGKLPAIQIGSRGQIMEWRQEYQEVEPGHRHISHLFGVYPGNLMSWEDTPELMKAARVSLEERLQNGGGHTGWSRAWIVLFWCRFHEGNQVLNHIQKLYELCTYDNLMDNHPLGEYGSVFQIDGNFGCAAGIQEMLVQQYGGRVILLPALPKELADGCMNGLRLKGAAVLSMTWSEGRVTSCTIRADRDWSQVICINGTERTVTLQKGEQICL